MATVGEVPGEVDHLRDPFPVNAAGLPAVGDLTLHRLDHHQDELVLVPELVCGAVGHRSSSRVAESDVRTSPSWFTRKSGNAVGVSTTSGGGGRASGSRLRLARLDAIAAIGPLEKRNRVGHHVLA